MLLRVKNLTQSAIRALSSPREVKSYACLAG